MINAKKVLKEIKEAVSLEEASLVQLKKEAEKSAKLRHHTLGPWKDYSSRAGSEAECTKCGADCEVLLAPHPNEIDIGGSAVAINCKD